ncbi:ABC transporter substrate-binding protein [Noviherbaspirillum sp. ST9]|uniref:ABC transporter substrate-binding protein n=1 Tax=Noviherbaspirillum sp. ST9 TaxID=3401606 RepID=UPI003B588DA2
MRTLKPLALAALCLSLATSAHAQKKYDTGASDTEIRIGNASPYSGPVSAYGAIGKAISAYMKMVNDRGGINGRKVNFITYDDQYSPPKTIEVTRRLVEQDEVLALSGNVGTGPNLAIQKYLNAKKVPHLMISVGTEKFNDPKNFPWTVPFNPSYEAEGRFFAQNILKTKPDAKIAVLYQNDDFGKDLLKGLKNGLGDKAAKMIVGEASYETSDPSVDSQIVQLKSTGANVFVNFSLARAAAQAIRKIHDLGWRPDQQYVTYVSAYVKTTFEPAGLDKSVGVMSMRFFKDAGQSRWDNDPDTKEYREFLKKYMPDEDINNSLIVYGYVSGQALEHVLKKAGDNLTRENILKQATTLKDAQFKMLMPGIAASNSPTDYFPINTMQMVRFNGKELEPVGEPVKLKHAAQ